MSNKSQYTLLHIANVAMAFAFFILGFSPDDGGGILHYAIADVPAFVPMGGAVDAEARRRGSGRRGRRLGRCDGLVRASSDGLRQVGQKRPTLPSRKLQRSGDSRLSSQETFLG